MSSNTTPAALRAAPGGLAPRAPSAARADPASDVEARRLAWQRAFESALRLPWGGARCPGAPADVPSTRPPLNARPLSAKDAPGAAPMASPSETRPDDAPAPAATRPEGGRGIVPPRPAPRCVQRRAAEDGAPPARVAVEETDPCLREAAPGERDERDELGEAVGSVHGGAESGLEQAGGGWGVADADPRGRVGWAVAPASEDPDGGRLLAPGSATIAGGAGRPATASGRAEHTAPAVARGVCSPVVVPVATRAGTPLAGLAPGASGPAADHLEPPLDQPLLVREQGPGASVPPREGGAASAREPVRCHAEWGEDGVRIWLGLDQDAEQSQPQLTRALVDQARTLVEAQGGRVLTVICNGKVAWSRRPPGGPSALHEQANGREGADGPLDVSFEEEDS